MKIFNKQSNKGFTIIETLVAIFILSIAITSFLGVVSQSILTARYTKNEITANYLAQESADYIRNQRDTVAFLNNTGGVGWETFLSNFGDSSNRTVCFSQQGCSFDIDPTKTVSIESCSTECPVIKINGEDSNFKRRIIMEESNTGDIKQVFVYITIEWLNGGSTKTKTLNFSLSNWLDY